jgi:WD40 repeat protein
MCCSPRRCGLTFTTVTDLLRAGRERSKCAPVSKVTCLLYSDVVWTRSTDVRRAVRQLAAKAKFAELRLRLTEFGRRAAWISARIDALWGYDVFIAHRQIDGAGYAGALYRALSEERPPIATFIDTAVYAGGDPLSVATRVHAAKSSLFLLVGTPQVLARRRPVDWVESELREYLATHRSHPKVLIVDFGSAIGAGIDQERALGGGEPGSVVHQIAAYDFLRISLPAQALADAPSADILDEIRKNLAGRRRDRTRLRVFQVIAFGLLLLSGAALLETYRARVAEAESNNSLRTSRLQTARIACHDIIVGSRDIGVQALQEAAKIRPGDDLKTAFLECMQRPGLRELSDRQGLSEAHPIMPGDPIVDQVGKTKATLRPAAEKDRFTISIERDAKVLATWPVVASEADSLRLSPDGAMIAVMLKQFGGTEQTVDVFASETGKRLWSLRVEMDNLGWWSASWGRISFSASGRYIAAAGIAGSIVAWDLSATDGPVIALQSRPFSSQAILTALSPDGRWVAAMDDEGSLVVVEVETNEVVASAPRAEAMQAPNSSILEWTSQDRITVGAKQWQWLPPADRGFWARANIGRQRSITDIVFNPQGTMVGVATEYGGSPYILEISAREAKMLGPLKMNGEFPSGLESIAFPGSNGSVCGAELSAVVCWDMKSGYEKVISGRDFSRTYRELRADDYRVVAAGDRNITLLKALDTKGNLLWQRSIERTSTFGLGAVLDESGQYMIFKSTDRSTAFEVITVTDGGTVQTRREDDPNEILLPVRFENGFALLDRDDVSLRALSDGALLAGPYAVAGAGRANSDMIVRGKTVVARATTGQLTFWRIGAGKCSPKSTAQPRNQSIALSSSGTHFAAFDGEVLKVWDTMTCEGVEIPTGDDGSSIADLVFAPNDGTIRFRSAPNEITTYELDTKRASRTVFKPLDKCQFGVGSGWSGDGGTLWQACEVDKSIVVKAWRAADGGSEFEVTTAAEGQGGTTVVVDPKQRTIIVRNELTKPAIWGWSLNEASAMEKDLCRLVDVDNSAKVRLLDDGAQAAFLSQGEKDGAEADLQILDTRSCESTLIRAPFAEAALGITPSGGVVAATDSAIKTFSRKGQIEKTLLENAGRFRRAALSANGELLAAALEDGSVLVRKVGRPEPMYRFAVGPGEVNTLAFSPNGSWLATGTKAGRVHLWPLAALDADTAEVFRDDRR